MPTGPGRRSRCFSFCGVMGSCSLVKAGFPWSTSPLGRMVCPMFHIQPITGSRWWDRRSPLLTPRYWSSRGPPHVVHHVQSAKIAQLGIATNKHRLELGRVLEKIEPQGVRFLRGERLPLHAQPPQIVGHRLRCRIPVHPAPLGSARHAFNVSHSGVPGQAHWYRFRHRRRMRSLRLRISIAIRIIVRITVHITVRRLV